MATEPKNLYEYYTSKGLPLPSIADRSKIYESSGLGSAATYQGTAEQNTAFLGKLLSSPATTEVPGIGTLTVTPKNVNPQTPVTNPDQNIEGLYQRTGLNPPAPLVAPPGTPPPGPQLVPTYGTKYQSSPVINSINSIAGTLDKVSADILASKTASEEEKQLAKDLVAKRGALDQFDTDTLKRIEAYSGTGRGQTQGFVVQNQEKERKTRALERLGFAQEVANITDQLQLSQDERKNMGEVASTQWDIANKKVDLAMGIFKEMERLDDKEQSEARSYLLDVIDFSKGKKFEELDQLTQAQIIASVANSPITLDMVKTALSQGSTEAQKASTSIVEINGVKKLINDQTGETIKILGYEPKNTPNPGGDNPTTPTSFTSILTKNQIYSLRSAGLADQTINDITKWLSAGISLEEIRQQLRGKKIDPQVLDTFDRVVSIANFLDPARTQFKSTETGREG